MSHLVCAGRFTTHHPILRLAILCALLLPAPLLAATFTCAQTSSSNVTDFGKGTAIDQLEDVVVTGSKPKARTKDLGTWLKRLEGQYRYEGYVDLCGSGNLEDQRRVAGRADCVSLYGTFTDIPGSLYCRVNLDWPAEAGGARAVAGESNLSPAVIVYGLVPDLPGIQVMQMDDGGLTTHALGKLIDDTLTIKGSCGTKFSCSKITRTTARPDSKEISILTDFEIDSRLVLRHAFVLHRVSNIRTSQDGHIGRGSGRSNIGLDMVELQSVGQR